MPSTHTTRNRLEKQAPGENQDTWGERLNDNVIELTDEALDGVEVLTVSGTVSLTSASDATDQARKRALWCSGTGGSIVIPNVQKTYHVYNGTSGNIVVTTGSGTSATIRAGNGQTVVSNGSNAVQALQVTDYGSATIQSTGSAKFGSLTRSSPDKGFLDLGASGTGVNLIAASFATGLTANTLGNAYGIGFANVSFASFLSGFATGVNGWGCYVAANGVARVFLDGDNGRVQLANTNAFSGYYFGANRLLADRKIGWGLPSGTLTRTTFSPSTITLQQLAERVAALITDLSAHGLIGA